MNCRKAMYSSDNEVKLKLHIMPHSSESRFPSGYNRWRQCLEAKVRNKAKDGKANFELINLISQFFHISPKNIQIIAGMKSKEKLIAIRTCDYEKLCRKIEESLDGL